MNTDDNSKIISIIHEAYNPYYAEFFDLIFKFSYAFEDVEKSHLEIFLNDSEAKDHLESRFLQTIFETDTHQSA